MCYRNVHYHEVNGATSSKDMGTGYNGFPSIQPFRCPGLVERGCLGIEFHVPRIDSGAIYPFETQSVCHGYGPNGNSSLLPWIIQVVFACLNQQDLKIVIEVSEAAGWHTACAATTADDDIDLFGNGHLGAKLQWIK